MTTVEDHSHPFEPGELGADESAHFWVDPRFDGLECLHARFIDYAYSPHFHDTYVLGHVERGVEHCRSRGLDFSLTPGQSMTVINPGDLHDGRPGEEGFEYRMLYPSMDLMREASAELDEGAEGIPWFTDSYIEDVELRGRIARLHRLLQEGGARLECDSLMLETLVMLIQRHSDKRVSLAPVGDEAGPVARVLDFVRDRLDQDVALSELADVAGLNRYRLIRAFRKEMGLTPHAYVINKRVQKARELLKSGAKPAAAAVQSGFYDQAHLSKAFKRVVGVTPGAYAKACHG